MSLLSIVEVRALTQVPVGVGDERLQIFIDAAEQEILAGCGPHAYTYIDGVPDAAPLQVTRKIFAPNANYLIALPRKFAAVESVDGATDGFTLLDNLFIRSSGSAYRAGEHTVVGIYANYDSVRKAVALALISLNAIDTMSNLQPLEKIDTTIKRERLMMRITQAETGLVALA